jgi:haloalkane dehalogenase
MPQAYADRRKLTRAIHAQYLAPFPDAWSRGAVLWPLAHAILGSSAYYDSLWARRDELRDIPTLVVWGMYDPALRPYQLRRWRTILPTARTVELEAGHWPHEELPDAVVSAVRAFVV